MINTLNIRYAAIRRRKIRIRNAIGLFQSLSHGRKERAIFGTLTYRPGVDWEPYHISSYVDDLYQWAKRHEVTLHMVWVAEMQERGAVHYHYALWVPRHLTVPMPDKQGWWTHGLTNVQYVKKSIYKYLSKYMTKPDDAARPKGLRSYGFVGLDEKNKNFLRVWSCPEWLKRYIFEHAVIKKIGRYWLDLTEKKMYLGPFRCYGKCGENLILENVGYVTVYRLEDGFDPKSTPGPIPPPNNTPQGLFYHPPSSRRETGYRPSY